MVCGQSSLCAPKNRRNGRINLPLHKKSEPVRGNWSADSAGQIGRELLKVADVAGVDAVASGLPGAGEVERVVDSSTDPAMIGAGLYRIAIHSCEGDNFKIAKNVRGNDFPRFQGMNRRRERSASQHGVQFGKTVAADAAGHGFVVDCQESGKRLSVVRVAGDRSRDQDRGIEIGFHSPEASLICSSLMATDWPEQKPWARRR